MVSEVTAQQVSRDHFPFTLRRGVIWMARAALGEDQLVGDGGDFHGARLGAAVPALAGVTQATGTSRQGRRASWECRPGWLRLTIST